MVHDLEFLVATKIKVDWVL
jgi:hypothetical protein